MNIKPIETVYNGHRFRSRLEARWAVFFDAVGIRYEYEPEGFKLSNGTKYLPDFYFPNYRYYAEVKGSNDHLVNDILKVKRFALEAKTAVVILGEIPYDPDAKGLFWFPSVNYVARIGRRLECNYVFFEAYETHDNSIRACLQDDFFVGRSHYWNVDESSSNEQAANAIRSKSGATMDEDDPGFEIKDSFPLYVIDNALTKARQARFEHGETPTGRR